MFTRPGSWGVLILAVLVVVVSAAPAGAVGYWNMPTSASQWWGYGCGPGYHAPMVLGPMTAQELVRPNMIRRLPCPPPAECCWSGYGCCGAEMMEEPTMLPEAAPQPQPQPAATPGPSATWPVRSRSAGFVLQ